MGAELPFLGGRVVGVWLPAQIFHVGFRWQGGMKGEEAHCALAAGKGNMDSILFTRCPCLDLSCFSFGVCTIYMNYFLAFSYLPNWKKFLWFVATIPTQIIVDSPPGRLRLLSFLTAFWGCERDHQWHQRAWFGLMKSPDVQLQQSPQPLND